MFLAVALVAAIATPASAGERIKPVGGPLNVFAASSLTEAFAAIGEKFERKNPDADITFNFSSSSTLATQIEQGAPADVFASADVRTMDRLVAGGQVPEGGGRGGDVPVFARNRLAIAVALGNPKKIKTLADTLDGRVTLVLCAPEVPCGKYAMQAYENAGLTVPQVPTGASAKDTLAKVSLGEADAAVVYVTDVEAASGDVDGVKIPDRDNVNALYPISPIVNSPNERGGKAFIIYVQSKAGQRILRRFGFLEP
ncbi:MAG: molybdate ABC transporter substrate-binding protein [Acidimicrobiia bacterium]